jgi:serine/threonine protein kinase
VDVWAVGVIAYLLLKRVLPFSSEYEADLIQKIITTEPNYEGLSVWEQEFLQRLLCKDPTKRTTALEALTSPFLFINSKGGHGPFHPKTITIAKSPSLGSEEFAQQGMIKELSIPNKFYDDNLAKIFLGSDEADIGVVRWDEENEENVLDEDS